MSCLSASTYLLPALKAAFPALGHLLTTRPLSPAAWTEFYLADPINGFVATQIMFMVGVYAAQQITGNSSQVDRLWTTIPLFYTAHFVLHPWLTGAGLPPRLLLMLLCTALWSARLTSNAVRRGVYKRGEEDYRWPVLRRNMSRWQWQLFSIFFISVVQIILLGATGFPAYLLLTSTWGAAAPARPITALGWGDGALVLLFLANCALQTAADEQQWVYQNYKRDRDPALCLGGGGSGGGALTPSRRAQIEARHGLTRKDAQRGFNTAGLFAWSRHPNFAHEQGNWWILYLFVPYTFGGSASWVSYALVAPVGMSVLFLGSTPFTEQISGGKYGAAYAAYQARVDPFCPALTLARAALLTRLYGAQHVAHLDQQIWPSSRSAAADAPRSAQPGQPGRSSGYGAIQE